VSLVALGLEAMATRFELLLGGDDPARLRAAGEEALREIERAEGLLSRYRPSSAIAAINAAAGGAPVRVDPRLLALLGRCAEISRLTDGAFDVTVGPLLRAWGFVGGSGAAPDPETLARARGLVGMEGLELDEGAGTVRLSRAGMELDLGAVGKGYAIDRAIAVLEEHGVPRGLLHGGTSSVHVFGHVSDGEPWRIAWRAPGGRDRPRTLTAARPALSVSASHGKAFAFDGRVMGHVLDPRKGAPAGQALSACVVGASSTVCDALSTALLVSGVPGCAWLGQRFRGYRGWVVTTPSYPRRNRSSTCRRDGAAAPNAACRSRTAPS
jgi:thiamine biosynthesis lipoprotein